MEVRLFPPQPKMQKKVATHSRWPPSFNYFSIVGLGVGAGVPGVGVGHGFFGSSPVQGVGDGVGVCFACADACALL